MLPGIVSTLRATLDDVIKRSQLNLAANERTVMTPGFKGEAVALREAATRFKTVFADIVEPYIRGCLEASIGNKDGAHRYHMVLYEKLKELETEAEVEQGAEPTDEALPPTNQSEEGTGGPSKESADLQAESNSAPAESAT